MDFIGAIEARRSLYGLSARSPISDDALIALVERVVRCMPSPFNSQSARVVVLLGHEHARLWEIVLEALRAAVPASRFAASREKIAAFAAGYGTLLFGDDTPVILRFAQQYPAFAGQFPSWSDHANGMVQFALWTALEAEGLGASLQHYNPLIDDAVKAAFHLPAQWRLVAQMPFGLPTAPAQEKDFLPIEQRVWVRR